MSKLNTGPTTARTRISVITLFSVLFFGLALLVVLPGGTTSAGSPPSKTSNQASPSYMCGQVVSSPSPGTGAGLNAVAAVSANDVWAVGSYSGRTLVEHWNGSAWMVIPSPNMEASTDGLQGVAAVSADDVWAVGTYIQVYNEERTLVEHWDGTSWGIITSPNGSTGSNYLTAVSAVSATDVWAVGLYFSGSVAQTLAEHWDGTTWTIIPSPSPSTVHNYLYGVAAVSKKDVWAVGSRWGPNDPTDERTLVEHWDGSAWSVVPSADLGDAKAFLYAVSAVSSNDVWAVGWRGWPGPSPLFTLVEHWDGSAWTVVSSPNPIGSNSRLVGVAAAAANDVWAVGASDWTLVEHWDGRSWAMVSSPNPGIDGNNLWGVAAVSADDVWAVGKYDNGSSDETLVERFEACACTQFTDVPAGSTFYDFVTCLACRGLISGYPDGSFKPNNDVTRGQLSKIVSNSAGFNDPQPNQMFQDVPISSTYQVYIGNLAARGFIRGYACGGPGEPCMAPDNLPYFRPNKTATRGQISKIVSDARWFDDNPTGQQFEDVEVGSTYYTYTYRLVSHSIMSGYPCGGPGEPCGPANLPYFRPNNKATRGQTSKIVANTFFPDCQTTTGTNR
jgi:hypothetical protein